ncbi:Purine nucleoside phosphorylase 1 [Rubripirellula tenax]|uniref:Purine nucleoside phosphorylase n=1 Tax=Rubripirellula tenax TaxID=2528015 RepID=A0A5C6FA36_9BACT|nr:purine-nucleoside phosphorylase [Rubripirellula tenax]TWU58623.1 Purine nucleoside phosphorylase 1 [Rubripirellula tenax]
MLTTKAADFIRSEHDLRPVVAIILGSGLGGLAEKIESPTAIPFHDIPGFGTSTAAGHRGQLILGTIESVPVVTMAGRFHRYEGWSNTEVAFPVAVMHSLGCRSLIVSNAAGGVSPKLRVGNIVVIQDHINLMGPHVVDREDASNRERSVQLDPPHFTRPANTYDPILSATALGVAIREGFDAYPGTYLATLGPNYETRAEYRMMRRIGADVVGMSTVPEVLAASSLGMRILGLSMVSNVANPDQAVKANHEEVLHAGRAAEVKMEAIVRGVLRTFLSTSL